MLALLRMSMSMVHDVDGDEYLLMLTKNGDVGGESECLCWCCVWMIMLMFLFSWWILATRLNWTKKAIGMNFNWSVVLYQLFWWTKKAELHQLYCILMDSMTMNAMDFSFCYTTMNAMDFTWFLKEPNCIRCLWFDLSPFCFYYA